MAKHYIELCEGLWREWLAESLDVSSFIESTFDLQAAPEPYVLFNAGLQPLIALLTNPGQTMPHQLRENVKEDGVSVRALEAVVSVVQGRWFAARPR